RGASSLLTMLFWRRGGVGGGRGWGAMLGGAFPNKWGPLRSLFLVVFRGGGSGSLTGGGVLRPRCVLGGDACGAVRRGRVCVRGLCRGIGFGACWDRRRLFCAWWSFAACDASDQPHAFEP